MLLQPLIQNAFQYFMVDQTQQDLNGHAFRERLPYSNVDFFKLKSFDFHIGAMSFPTHFVCIRLPFLHFRWVRVSAMTMRFIFYLPTENSPQMPLYAKRRCNASEP